MIELGDDGQKRIVLSSIFLIFGIILFILSDPPWTTPTAVTAYYSVLSFLCVTMTASAATKIRTDPSPTNRWFVAGTSYAAIIFCGAAIFYNFSNENPVAHYATAGVFLNLVAFATTGIFMLFFCYIERYEIKKTSILYHRMVVPVTVIIGSFVFVMIMIAIRMITNHYIFLIAGYFTGTVAIVSYLAAGYLMYSLRDSESTHDTLRLTLVFALLAAASINHTIILPSPSALWILSISLMALAFLYANVATSYTFLLNVGVRKNLAYGVTIFLSALVLLPFLASRFMIINFPITSFIEIGAKVLIHLTAAILAGGSAYAFYERIKYRPSPGQQWIIFLLLYWMIGEVWLVFSHLLPSYQIASESLVPYICGSIVSSIVLPMSVRSILKREPSEKKLSHSFYALALIGSALMIIIGEILRAQLILGIEVGTLRAVGTAIMLSLSYVSLFILLMYVLLLTSATGGRFSFNSLGAGFVAVWMVVTILKVNYATWTIGYWSAEIVMILAIITFILMLGRMYIIDTNRAEKREKRAVAYSRFLSEILSSRQTAVIDSLSDIIMDSTTSDSVLNSVSNAMSDISKANELSKHIGTLIAGDGFAQEQIGPVSLRDFIYSAMERAGVSSTEDSVKVGDGTQSIELRMEHDCTVLANSFLIDALQYILEGISKRIGNFDSVSISIAEKIEDSRHLCICNINLDVHVEEPEMMLGLVDRYFEKSSLDAVELAFSKQIVILLGGAISWNATMSGEKNISITVSIQLQKAK